MDPVALPPHAESALASLAARSDAELDAACATAVDVLARGARAGERFGSECAASRALAWFFVACASGGVREDGVETRLRARGFDHERASLVGRAYARGRAAATRGTATSRGARYDGLTWRLDGVVASRSSLVEGEAMYLMELGRIGGKGRVTSLCECDYQTLRALRETCERALAASEGARAVRLARYVRRPKT